MPAGTLYLIPAPLGEVPWPQVLPAETRAIACRIERFVVENARTARACLKWLGHPLPLRDLAIEELPATLDATRIEQLIAPLQQGSDLGLMSEAGCPGVADPGALLVRRAHALGIQVRPLVGPSSLLLALMASGLDGQRFAFHGYLPQRDPERTKRILELERESHQQRQTQLFIETPYRNAALFAALLQTCRAPTLLSVATDLTLPQERIVTKSVGEWRRLAGADFSLDRRPTVFLLLSAG